MLFNNLFTAFPWYDKKEKQLRYRAGNDYSLPFLISPNNAILPFQFRKPSNGRMPVSWKVFHVDGTEYFDMSVHIPDLNKRTVGGYDYFWIVPNTPMIVGDVITQTMEDGCYYCVIDFPTGVDMYSEVFHVKTFQVDTPGICPYIKIEWDNQEGDVKPIYYPDDLPFKNRVYLDSRITSSEPEILRQVETNANQVEIPEFQRAAVKYRIQTFAPDYLVIALTLASMHDNVTLATENNVENGEMTNVLVTANPEEGGIFSTVDIVFENELLIIAKSCGEDMQPDSCPPMVSDESLNIDIIIVGAQWLITATLPPYSYAADIMKQGTLIIGSAYVKTATNAELLAGVLIDMDPDIDSLSIKPKTFNCTMGESSPVDVP